MIISHFGTMFFADPVAAFSNIARAARPEARLVMLVWQSHDRNEWGDCHRRGAESWPSPHPGPPTARTPSR
jgi:hypothetical protein